MKKWLSDSERMLLEQWIDGTTHPMAATLQDGRVLYANKAWQRVIGYTDIEYDSGVKWTEITIDSNDLKLDTALALETMKGERQSYQFSKTYRHKEHHPIPGFVFVQRYPLTGGEEEFECFLVSFHPSQQTELSIITEFSKLNEQTHDILKQQIGSNAEISKALIKVHETSNEVKKIVETQLSRKTLVDLIHSFCYNIKEFTLKNKVYMYPFWGLLILLILNKHFGLDLISPLQDMGLLPKKSYSVEEIEAIREFLEKRASINEN